MGRRAKYLTNTERENASRLRKKAFLATEHGKRVRSEQNKRAYERRKEAQRLNNAVELSLPDIPSRVRSLATPCFDHLNPLFQQGFRSTTLLEEDELYGQFAQPPPYFVAEELKEFGRWKATIVVQGKHERTLYMLDTQRLVDKYNRMDRAAFRKQLHEEILKHLEGWKGLCELVDKCRLEDFEAVGKGKENDEYISVYLARWDHPKYRIR
ncbi:hypothetical protein CVT26_005805 [Gymnopilus dilepis]|uniref:Uncharacterized protein n=1 Tax=Gymnopilus dilepis TaxID=231916 RepID=A0A409X9R3_9AGAR|nr:hypothetical protein CVT26_005805 [Gymnopilus dilepis]